MKKIPTMFERDWNGDRSRVTPQVHAGCEWVLAGEGVATRKIDGTCCMVRDGLLYKRREVRSNEPYPPEFEKADYDEETGKTVGWVLIGGGSDDRWHREAFEAAGFPADGTYELIGPKVQGNPEDSPMHMLIPHSMCERYEDVPRSFSDLRVWLLNHNIEGVVFHHPDGRMAKIKQRDFGHRRNKPQE